MFTRWLNLLNKKKIVLASGSPQRKTILRDLGLEFECIPSDFPENLDKSQMTPEDYVKLTSEKKFEEFVKVNKHLIEFDVLITGDCIVVHDGLVLEKPSDEKDIYDWFHKYSNNKVVVYTSVVVGIFQNNEIVKYKQFTCKTDVHFDEVDDEMIADYIKTGESYNRAGGFSIQGIGRVFIKKIEGCYFNVVGFPVHEFTKQFTQMLKEVYGDNGWIS